MYRCQEYVLYVWGPWLKPFWETENIISYDLLWYKSKLSAVNPIHNYSSVCEDEGKWVLYDMELACKIKISCFSQQILMKMFEIHFVDVYETSIIRFFGWEIFFFFKKPTCLFLICLPRFQNCRLNVKNAVLMFASGLKLNSCKLEEWEKKIVTLHFISAFCSFTVLLH